MTPQELLKIIEGTVVIAGIVAIFFAVLKDKTTKEVIRQQSEVITAYKERLDLLEKQHIDNVKAIGQLQGEVNAYKKIPLEKIANSIEKIANTNKQILDVVTSKEK